MLAYNSTLEALTKELTVEVEPQVSGLHPHFVSAIRCGGRRVSTCLHEWCNLQSK